MLTQTQFESLKRGSVSVDAEKSASRIIDAFKKASKAQKDEIAALSGISKFSFYKGTSSAKAVLSIAQIMSISPYFLTGESDSEDFAEDMLIEFFNKHTDGEKAKISKSKKSAAKEKPEKSTKTRSKSSAKKVAEEPETADFSAVEEEVVLAVEETKSEPVSVVNETEIVEVSEEPEVEVVAVSEESESEIASPVSTKIEVPEIDVETLAMLLQSLSVRAKFSGEAEKTYNAVVELLIK